MSNFNKLWFGQSASLVGSALTLFALPTLAILVFHATPAQVGFLDALQLVPFPLFGVVVGVLADRWPRRQIMIVADLCRALALATIPIAGLLGVLSLPQLYLVALCTGVCSVFFGITYQSYLPVIVDVDKLSAANTKLEISDSGAKMAGTALGGILVQTIGAAVSIGFDALSYLVSVFSLAAIRVPETIEAKPALSFRRALHEIAEGFEIVRSTPNLRWIAAATATTNLGCSITNAVTLIFAYRVLHLRPGLLGIVYATAELGFVGALMSSRVRQRLGLRGVLFSAIALVAVSNGCMLFALLGAPYLVLFVATALASVGFPIYNISQVSYRQSTVALSMQGRVNATMRTIVWSTFPIGALVGGYLGSVVGVPETILVGSIISLFAAVWLYPVHGLPDTLIGC